MCPGICFKPPCHALLQSSIVLSDTISSSGSSGPVGSGADGPDELAAAEDEEEPDASKSAVF